MAHIPTWLVTYEGFEIMVKAIDVSLSLNDPYLFTADGVNVISESKIVSVQKLS